MKQNLDSLKDEIRQYLDAEGFLVFHGHVRPLESGRYVRWNVDAHPDFRPFLTVARQAGVNLIVFAALQFGTALIEETLSELEEADMPREEKRLLERRLREFLAYEGFTSEIELSFDYLDHTYVFQLRTDWYTDYEDLLDEVDATIPPEDEDDEGPIGGYFSNN